MTPARPDNRTRRYYTTAQWLVMLNITLLAMVIRVVVWVVVWGWR